MTDLKKMASHVTTSSSIGLVFGAIVGFVSYNNEKSFANKIKHLKNDITNLKSDPEFLDAILNLHPYRMIGDKKMEVVFDRIVACADAIVHCQRQLENRIIETPRRVCGFAMGRYHRKLRDANTLLSQLCRERQGHGDVSDDEANLLTDYSIYSEAVLTIADNYLHNFMLSQ